MVLSELLTGRNPKNKQVALAHLTFEYPKSKVDVNNDLYFAPRKGVTEQALECREEMEDSR